MNKFLGEGPTIISSFDPDKEYQDVEIARCKYCRAECSSHYDTSFTWHCPVCRHSRAREDIYYVTERQLVDSSTHEGWVIRQWGIHDS